MVRLNNILFLIMIIEYILSSVFTRNPDQIIGTSRCSGFKKGLRVVKSVKSSNYMAKCSIQLTSEAHGNSSHIIGTSYGKIPSVQLYDVVCWQSCNVCLLTTTPNLCSELSAASQVLVKGLLGFFAAWLAKRNPQLASNTQERQGNFEAILAVDEHMRLDRPLNLCFEVERGLSSFYLNHNDAETSYPGSSFRMSRQYPT